ncbi:MAG: hypothetical protein VR65_03785 [Desulfobulbaceae bacterium BRH_c16a]|nr:MAG: hypothetical protein VR65_03785 [Desulfobulbaceae bacterium BRH_c16a]
MMTEWELQCRLTERWAADGLRINGRLHFLAAWEVMSPSWRINDSRRYWSEPSIDFLVADECLNLTAENHRQLFGRTSSAELKQQEIRRCVAAFKFGPSWPAVLSGFNQLVGDELQMRIRAELTSKAAEREVNRLTSIRRQTLIGCIHPSSR